ncbi:DUF2528 family protein [Citrobacter sp. S39]|uniref:DUF2528 family protein n=1 Tax=Citrobacter TaxID=544 RepID=UPI0012A8A892|nr:MULTISPECIES: DUF2528 family protein [Citrobacter]MDX7507470.1 DUF2528 family protein [Citrobacter freundii]QFX90708.1 DUF2528 family protein [Citrobacter sp. S39]HED1545434.1 DUF2528 family protein [Citrobacter freundii]
MTNIKVYKIDYDLKASVTIEIDHDIVSEADFHEINNFWMNADWRVEQNGGVINAVLKMLAREIMYIQFPDGYTIDGLIKQFDWDSGNGQEGWPPMDGSHGIKIIDTEDLELENDDMSIEIL